MYFADFVDYVLRVERHETETCKRKKKRWKINYACILTNKCDWGGVGENSNRGESGGRGKYFMVSNGNGMGRNTTLHTRHQDEPFRTSKGEYDDYTRNRDNIPTDDNDHNYYAITTRYT